MQWRDMSAEQKKEYLEEHAQYGWRCPDSNVSHVWILRTEKSRDDYLAAYSTREIALQRLKEAMDEDEGEEYWLCPISFE
jgi:hypothetical protein